MSELEEIKLILKELAISQKETETKFKETDAKFKETDKKIANIGKQIGGIGEKFGYFTEGLALNSMEKILFEKFKVDHVSPRVKVKDENSNQIIAEIDVFGYCNSEINNAVLVEVKSNLNLKHIEEFENLLKSFDSLFPEHKGKNVYGIISTPTNFNQSIKEYLKRLGIHTATIHDDAFHLNEDKDFIAKNYKK